MRAKPIKRAEGALDESCIAALARAANESHEVIVGDQQATIAQLQAQTQRYQTAIDSIAQGVCFFDGEERLILSNRRYAEIYRLAPERIRPGMTLREIVELRVAAGTCATATDDYLSVYASNNPGNEPRTWSIMLGDGRNVQIRHQPMPDGGWVSEHEDNAEFQEKRAIADERMSLQTLIDWLPDNLWVKDVKSRFVISNKATATRIGLPGPADLIGKCDLELLPPEIAKKFFADEQQIIRTGKPMVDMEEYVFDESGGKTWILTTKVPLRNDHDEIFGVAGMSRDISERKLADALRDGQAQILEMIAMNAPLEDVLDRLVRLVESQLTGIFGSILLVDEDGTRLRHGAAPNLPEAYVKAVDGLGVGPNAGSSGTAAYRREAVIVADAQTDPLWADYRNFAAANGLRSCWSIPILSNRGEVRGVFAMYSKEAREPSPAEMRLVDIATHMAGIAIERKLAEDRIQFMANHDALTGLPNRTLLNDRLSQALLYAQRYDRWATVAFVDLDNFKNINDSLGHNAGDELLKAVAKRMVACLRATDTVVRIGGDEFVILLFDQPKSAQLVSATLQKIQAAISEPVVIDGHTLRVTSSFGVANYPDDGTDAETLLANADAAMYRAKELGRDNFRFYTPELNARVHEKFLLQEELRNAVARREFVLYYQPQVDLRTGRVFAVEALIRWKHPTLGVLSPIKFIPMAEETG
ncbi:MAG: diguanylate cyclase, partial [Roseiarcus sp.]